MSTQMPDLASARLAAARERASTTVVSVLLVVLVACFCLMTGWMSLVMRHQVWATATQNSRNLLSSEIAGIDRILTIYDASLRSAAATIRNPDLRGASPELRRLAIFDGIQDTPELGPVRILAADATVLYDSATVTPPEASAAERRALAVHAASTAADARISQPFPIGQGSFAVTLSHRLATSDGMFAGIVVGTIDLDIFQKQFAQLTVGTHDAVSLFSDDGVMLAHIPGNPLVGRSIAGTRLLAQFKAEDSGTFIAHAALDGVRRAFSFKHIAPWPLFLDVGVGTDDLYRPWLFRTIVTVCLMTALIIFAVFLLRLLRRDAQARVAAEANLVASEHRYRMLAESASDVVVRVDRQTIRTYVSPSCSQYGYEPADLVGLTSSSWVHDDDLIAMRTAVLRVIDDEVDGVVRYRLRHKNGTHSWVEAHLNPVQQGGYLGIIRNIDKQVQGAASGGTEPADEVARTTVDDLTGLANRALFEQALPERWREAVEGKRPLSLLLVEIDGLDAHHDHHGHKAADGVIVEVARVVASHAARAGGLAARCDPNEFAVLLPRVDLGAAVEAADAIRAAVSGAGMDSVPSPSGHVTVSVGAATVMPGISAASPAALVKAAEEARARVRQGGCNQVQAGLAMA